MSYSSSSKEVFLTRKQTKTRMISNILIKNCIIYRYIFQTFALYLIGLPFLAFLPFFTLTFLIGLLSGDSITTSTTSSLIGSGGSKAFYIAAFCLTTSEFNA